MSLCLDNPEIMVPLYSGLVLDVVMAPIDEQNRYTVYIDSLKLLTTYLSTDTLVVGMCYEFKLFVFRDEHNIKKKVRIIRITA